MLVVQAVPADAVTVQVHAGSEQGHLGCIDVDADDQRTVVTQRVLPPAPGMEPACHALAQCGEESALAVGDRPKSNHPGSSIPSR